MTNEELKKIWSEKFAVVPQVLENMKQVQAAATAFNTNVDAVVKISGKLPSWLPVWEWIWPSWKMCGRLSWTQAKTWLKAFSNVLPKGLPKNG